MKPRVVILSAFLTPRRSGAEACAEEVALRLGDRYDITIVTGQYSRALPKRDQLRGEVPIVRIGFGFGFDKWLYPFLAPLAARRLKPDLIHAILETFAGVALHACRMIVPKAKQVLTLQTTNRHFLRRHILRTPHKVTAISCALRDIAAAHGRSDVTVIPNGMDGDAIRAACALVRKIPGRILFVGRLESMKGVDTLLKAFATLTAMQIDRTVMRLGRLGVLQPALHIVGDGSQRRALEKIARDLRIADRVHFCGYLRDQELHREYAEAEVFCGLSRSEGLGNVFLEAQTAGCAVVATNVGGIPEIVTDRTTGILVPADDPDAAAKAMHRLLSDGVLRQKLAVAGQESAKQFDWNAVSTQYAGLYDDLLSRTS